MISGFHFRLNTIMPTRASALLRFIEQLHRSIDTRGLYRLLKCYEDGKYAISEMGELSGHFHGGGSFALRR